MEIYFKSKSSIVISDEVAEALQKALKAGADEWQAFVDKQGKLFLVVNLKEVEFIA